MKKILLQILFLFAGFSLSAQVNLQNGLLARYMLNGNVRDTSGNNRHGEKFGNLADATNRFGENTKAYYFDSAGIEVPAFNCYTSQKISFCTWVKVSEFQNQLPYSSTLMLMSFIGANGVLRIGDSDLDKNRPQFALGDNCEVNANTLLDTGKYYFIVGTYNGSEMKIYINGRLDGRTTASFTMTQDVGFHIGKLYYSRFLKGCLDDVRVYNRDLNEDEIIALYLEGQKLGVFKPDSVIGVGQNVNLHWTFDSTQVSSVNILYSTNNGATWNTILNNTKLNQINWVCPNEMTNTLSLRVANSANPNEYNQVDSIKVILSEKLKFYYPFNSNVLDFSGNGNHAITDITNFENDHNGITKRAISFTQNNLNVKLPSFKFGGAFSVSAWVFTPNPRSNYARIIDFSNGESSDNILLGFQGTTGKVFAEVFDNWQNGPQLITTDTFPANTWVNVTYVNDGNGTGYIYWNGVLKAQGSQRSPRNLVRQNNFIGKSAWAFDGSYIGKFDELYFFERALSVNEVNRLYKQSSDLKLLTPNRTTKLMLNSSNKIKWYANQDSIQSVNIDYSVDEGQSWVNIAKNVQADNITWENHLTSNNVLLKVSDYSNSLRFDLSDNIMLVSDSLEVGLMAHYKLDGNGKDTSGYDLNGVINSESWSNDRFDKPNSAYAISASDTTTYVKVPNNVLLNPDVITISSWFRITSSFVGMGSEPIIEKSYTTHNEPYYQYHLWVVGDQYPSYPFRNKIGVSISLNGVTTSLSLCSASQWELNKWHFVAATFDGKNFKLYIDGTLESEISLSTYKPLAKYNTDLFIGKKRNVVTNLPADIDEVRIYNRVLSANEIKKMNCQRPFNVNAGEDVSVCSGNSVTLNATGNYDSTHWTGGITNNQPFTPISTCNYIVAASFPYACIKKDTVNVTVNPLPTVSAGNDIVITQGESVTLTASGNAASYTWNHGVTNGVAFIPDSTDIYTVTGISSENCSNTDQLLVTVNPNNILEENLSNINIYPNPVTDVLYIQNLTKIKSVKIFNVLGVLVKNIDENENTNSVSFKDLPIGMYFLKMMSENKIISFKVTKK